MSSPVQAMHEHPVRKPGDIGDLLRICLDQTIQAIQATGIATDTDIARTRVAYERSVAKDEPQDVLELLARVQGAEEEHVGSEVARITHAVSSVIHPSPPLIPFAGKLIAPSAFYESFDHIHKVARALLAPVLYAEDTDSIGTGALNPVAARIMADEILGTVDRRFGIKPFVTSVRMDYESWAFLTRKHFAL
ncbi:hypothetical protein OJ996_16165 [Luteolibacter sp. GHJ8]|uniref:Uncharacterized protein n=1 Tax=Luteolibacter rhizosphaerae TaxID=2989719 RepID=A0ABT3G634_9BACT|nr:hypothetical protein [Luteolibacter rhizosphaerae]MCW1915122.1 hypothetical protein [Luteolibacter rhizosphaerae]